MPTISSLWILEIKSFLALKHNKQKSTKIYNLPVSEACFPIRHQMICVSRQLRFMSGGACVSKKPLVTKH